MLTVGIPKEIKIGEKRVGLTPYGVKRLTGQGIPVLVEIAAGFGSGYSDEEYVQSGAKITATAKQLFDSADLIQKVKEPLAAESPLLREGQILFCFLHLASPENCNLVKALLRSKVTAIGYETVEAEGRTPLLKPMSEIAGALAAAYAAFFREKDLIHAKPFKFTQDLREDLLRIASRYPLPPRNLKIGRVIIFGGGVAGEKALEFALKMGGSVTLVEKSESRRKTLQQDLKRHGENHVAIVSPEELKSAALTQAEVLIGCVHMPGWRALRIMDLATLQSISAGQKKIIMDVAVDQGGNFPETHATSYENPVYQDSLGNLRFAVANIPSLCGRGASEALTDATVRYTSAMAANFTEALQKFPELARAINIQNSEIKIPAIQEAHRL